MLPEGSILATLDITVMYTNIPLKEGVLAAEQALNRSRKGLGFKPTNKTLIKLLKMVLTLNNFTFNGSHFVQIKGTAIGTKLASGFAIDFGDWFERMFVYLFHKQPLLWLRFIDDIFIIWTHGEEALQEFFIFLNTRIDSIKFTCEISRVSVNFLDTTVKIVGNKIVTDLYCKPTDSHSYLQYNSSHPQRCKDSIPYSQFLRVRRICSNLEDFDRNVLVFMMHFLRRGYPMKLLEEAHQLARKKERRELLHKLKVPKSQDGVSPNVFLITTFHPVDHTLRKIVFNNWELLGKSPTTTGLHEKKLMLGYRRPKNLRDTLVRANLPYKGWDEDARPKHFPPL
jgi:hypothetical protein